MQGLSQGIRTAPGTIIVEDAAPRTLPQAMAKIGITHQDCHRMRKLPGAVWRYKNAVIFTFDKFRHAPGSCSDDRQTTCHGFHVSHAKGLMSAGKDESIRILQFLTHSFLCYGTHKLDGAFKSVLNDQCIKFPMVTGPALLIFSGNTDLEIQFLALVP